ncbi:Na+/H+ antiporter NhaC [Lentibacillus sp. L22]|uniref:Na+/H+ antiporter NhaC n=1 Tax=Lentibacillus TaxID=175304 RepID=UPI0022B1DCA1|nr:Na+/H+ antiporter NhaC [Lentibacillus daqui]
MKKVQREPGLLLALVPVISMLVLLSLGIGIYDLPAEPLILVSTLIAGVIALYLGYSFDDIMESVSEKIGKVMPAILILITVGFMIGAWMVGGTIPMLIYYGLKIISPEYIFVTAFIVTSVVAIFTGTSWGAAGSIGVAFMGVAIGMDTNLGAVAGAVVSGAYFGDKLSPLSDTTNLASLSTGVNLYDHIKHLLYTTVPSFVVAGIVYLIAGFMISDGKGVIPDSVFEIMDTLDQIYDWNLLYILPLIIVLYGAIRKKPTIPVMLLASFVAMANGMIFEGFSLNDVIVSTLNGFDLSMVSGFDTSNVIEDIPTLLNRGGMMSMMNTLLIAIVAIAFAGTMMVSNSLHVIINNLLKVVKSTFGLIASTIVTCLTTIGVTSNGQISILIPGEALKDAYIKRGLHPKNLSRTIEDSATIIEPILPWTAAGAYMAGTLGVSTLSYLPWAVLNYSGIIFALIWAFTGFGIAKLGSDESEHKTTGESA